MAGASVLMQCIMDIFVSNRSYQCHWVFNEMNKNIILAA